MIELRNLAKAQLMSLEKLNQSDIKNYTSKIIIDFSSGTGTGAGLQI